MVGDILNAVILECKALLADSGGEVIFKTDYKSDNLASYKMPLLLLDLLEGAETCQYLGGVSMLDWSFALNSYHYSPDSYTDDTSGYSTGLINCLDKVRRHFSYGVWLTEGMTDILNNYGFRFTLSGIVPADALDQDGLIKGYRIIFDSISIDTVTALVAESTSVLEDVVQEDYPPEGETLLSL